MVIWDVAKVNRYVKQLIDADERLADLWVEGEVSNFVVAMSGHAFFTLKEAQSQLRCVMFRQQLARIRQRPANGDLCVARGALRSVAFPRPSAVALSVAVIAVIAGALALAAGR